MEEKEEEEEECQEEQGQWIGIRVASNHLVWGRIVEVNKTVNQLLEELSTLCLADNIEKGFDGINEPSQPVCVTGLEEQLAQV